MICQHETWWEICLQVEPPAAMGVGGGQTGLNPSSVGNTPISTDCSGCGELITDRFILQVAGRSWHGHCLRCVVCHSLLDGHASCFLRDDQLYCKLDYTKYDQPTLFQPYYKAFSTIQTYWISFASIPTDCLELNALSVTAWFRLPTGYEKLEIRSTIWLVSLAILANDSWAPAKNLVSVRTASFAKCITWKPSMEAALPRTVSIIECLTFSRLDQEVSSVQH